MSCASQGSGLRPVLHSHVEDSRISLAATASNVQAKGRCTDRCLFKVELDGNSPFVVQAAIHDVRRRCDAAAFLHSNLFPHLQRIAGSSTGLSDPRSVSPLYCAVIKLAHAFAKSLPKAPTKAAQAALLQTDCSIALLDIESGRLHTLCFGNHAHVSQVSGVATAAGDIVEPVCMREHKVRGTSVFEAAYDDFDGQQFVVLGSPGLWKFTHPRKAAIHASAYGTAPELSTFFNPHDSATAVVRSALQTVVSRCSASRAARLSCLHSLPQLDRLDLGCKAEAKGKGLIPRRRGDIHPDFTAAVLAFTLNQDSNPKSLPSTFGAAANCSGESVTDHRHVPQSLRALVAKGMHAAHAVEVDRATESSSYSLSARSADASARHHSATASTAVISSSLGVTPRRNRESSCKSNNSTNTTSTTANMRASCAFPSSNISTAQSRLPAKQAQHAKREFSEGMFDSIGSIDVHAGLTTTEPPVDTASATDDELCKCDTLLLGSLETNEAHRRWGLLRTHMAVRAREWKLRRNMWRVVVNSVMHPLAPAEGSSMSMFSSFNNACGSSPEREHNAFAAAAVAVENCKAAARAKAAGVELRSNTLFVQSVNSRPREDPGAAFNAGIKVVFEQLQQRKNVAEDLEPNPMSGLDALAAQGFVQNRIRGSAARSACHVGFHCDQILMNK